VEFENSYKTIQGSHIFKCSYIWYENMKFQTDNHDLVYHLFKARYFPNNDFLG